MTRTSVVSLVGVLALALVVACRQPPPPPLPLEPDPQWAAQWTRSNARFAEFDAERAMTAAQVAALEAVLVKDPEDGDARRTLMDFYLSADFGHKVVSWDEKVLARRRHVLWLMANDPDSALLQRAWPLITPAFDPAGYAQVRALWLAATSRTDASVTVLSRAADFFEPSDKFQTERLLLRAEALDPGGPLPRVGNGVSHLWWSLWLKRLGRLGRLYGDAIRDVRLSESGLPHNGVRSSDSDRAFALAARKRLEEANDVSTLVAAADALMSPFNSFRFPNDLLAAEFEALGASCVERAIRLEPGNTTALALRAWLASVQHYRSVQAALKGVPRQKREDAIRALPDADRLWALADYAARLRGAQAFRGFGDFGQQGWPSLDRARACAEDVLTLAGGRLDDPDRRAAIYSAHLTLCDIALTRNDLAGALAHLEAAGYAPPSDELEYRQSRAWGSVAVRLLKLGEREPVARFLDRLAARQSPSEELVKAAARIRAGRRPAFY